MHRCCRSLCALTFDLVFLLQQRTHQHRPAGGKRRLWSPPSVCSATPSRRYVSSALSREKGLLVAR